MLKITPYGSIDEQINYVTVTHVRKYRGRYPKFMNNGGFSRGVSYFYSGEGKHKIQTAIYELYWNAN